MLDASATTSFGLLYLLFHWAETSRIQAKSEHCLMYLKKIAVNSMSLISEGGGRCYLDNGEFNSRRLESATSLRVSNGATGVFEIHWLPLGPR